MRKNLLSLLMLTVMTVLGFSAQAQDYSVSVEWNLPDALEIYTDYNCTVKATPATSTATSATFDVKQDYYIKAANGYVLEAIVNNGTNINSWYNGKYNISQYGATEKNVTVTLGKLETVGNLTFNLVNGADCVKATLQNSANSALSTGTAIDCSKDGVQQVALTQYDNSLYITRSNYAQPIFYVKKNGETQTASYNNYTIAIAAGDEIEVAYYDPATYTPAAPAEVTLNLSGDAAAALNNIRVVNKSKIYWAADLEAADYKLDLMTNDVVRFSFKEDYTINSLTANGEPLTVSGDGYQTSQDYTITGNTVFAVDASAVVYEGGSMTVYLANEMEGIHFWSDYNQSAELAATLVGQTEADLTINGVTVPAGSYEYQINGIDGKTNRCFYTLGQNYFLAESAYNSGDPSDAIVTGTSLSVETAPYYLNVKQINYSSVAVIYYEGSADAARLTAQDITGFYTPYENQQTSLRPGYNYIYFDPEYNRSFTVRPMNVTEGQSLYAYHNGEALTADENGLFGTVLSDGSILKVFAAASAPAETTVTFTLNDGAQAEVSYDQLGNYTDFSAPLKSVGPTELIVRPYGDCTVVINGEPAVGEWGNYSFTANGATTVEITKIPFVAGNITVTASKPVEGGAVRKVAELYVTFSTDTPGKDNCMLGFDSEAVITLAGPNDQTWTLEASNYDAVYSGADSDDSNAQMIFNFSEYNITEAGEYTLTVPAGLVFEQDYEWNRIEGGGQSPAYTLHFTVDPTLANPMETYVLDPANGATQRAFPQFSVEFPLVSACSFDYMNQGSISLTNGELTYYGSAMPDYTTGNYRRMLITVQDPDTYESPVLTDGDWTLTIPEGVISGDGETNPQITATFHVSADAPLIVKTTPANGSNVEMPGRWSPISVSFSFIGASELSLEPTDEMAGLRVSYAGTEISRVEDTWEEVGYQLSYYSGDEVTISFSNDCFTKAGKLKIEMDEGYLTVNGSEASPAVSYEITVGDYKEYSAVLTPAPGTEVTSLAEITVGFPEAETAEFNEEGAWIILQSGNWIAPTMPEVTKVEDAEYPTFKLTYDLSEITLTPGSYRLMIDENSFILDGNQGNQEINAAWTLLRTTEINMSWNASPETYLINEGWGLYPSFVFAEGESVHITDYSGLTVKFDGEAIARSYGQDESVMYYYTSSEASSPNMLMFIIGGGKLFDATTTGSLSVEFAAGSVAISGVPTTEAISYTWNVILPKTYSVTVTPAGDTEVSTSQLSEITVEFTDATTAELYNQGFISLRSRDYTTYGMTQPAAVTAVEGAEHPTFKLSFEGVTALTDYIFNMRAGAFTLDGAFESPEVNCAYKVTSAVAGIIADENGLFTVYNMAGVLILKDAPAAELNSLNNGLYIVNGKKVLWTK